MAGSKVVEVASGEAGGGDDCPCHCPHPTYDDQSGAFSRAEVSDDEGRRRKADQGDGALSDDAYARRLRDGRASRAEEEDGWGGPRKERSLMGPPAGSIRRIGPDATPDPVESDRIGKAQRAEAQRDAPRGASSFGVFFRV